MSKILDRIRRLSRAEGPRLGFGTATPPKRRPMALLAELGVADLSLARQALAQGIDGLFFPSMAPAEQGEIIRDIAQAAADVPWGVRLAAPAAEDVAPLGEMGCDFVVIDSAAAPARLLVVEKPGQMLEIDGEAADSLLRAVDPLPVEIVLLADKGEGQITVADLMGFWRVVALVRKPLILAARAALDPADLASLRNCGVDGVAIRVGEGSPPERLVAFRQAIETLPTSRRRREYVDATLPPVSRPAEEQPPDETEE